MVCLASGSYDIDLFIWNKTIEEKSENNKRSIKERFLQNTHWR